MDSSWEPAVALTDAIAATAIAQRLGLPQRIFDLLEGESLVIDVNGLLALEFSIPTRSRKQLEYRASRNRRCRALFGTVKVVLSLFARGVFRGLERELDLLELRFSGV